MKTRYVFQIPCNDKVFVASENVFDKVLDEKVCYVQRYIYKYVPRKKKPASAKDSGDGTPSLCVKVSKDLSLPSNRLYEGCVGVVQRCVARSRTYCTRRSFKLCLSFLSCWARFLWVVVDCFPRRCLGVYHANVRCVRCLNRWRNRWRFPSYTDRCVPGVNLVWLPCR